MPLSMKLSVCLTINDRSIETLIQVFDSLKDQAHDELVIVLDKPPIEIGGFCFKYWAGEKRTLVWNIDRTPGWRSPVKAWNAGYQHVTGDLLYCLSSETVQAPGNIAKTKTILEATQAVLFGKAECSCGPQGQEVNWQGQAPGNLLCDAAHPRPLGFIWAAPFSYVQSIGGWDEAFDGGYWFDETDFFYRLWKTRLPFIFDDSVSGIHLHHDRHTLDSPAGQVGIQHNRQYLLRKYGSLDPLSGCLKDTSHVPGRTTWSHQ